MSKSTIQLLFFFLLTITRSRRLAEIRWSVCITYSQRSCLNFWDEACWYLSLRVFGLLSLCSLYDIRTVFTSGSTLLRYLFRVKLPTEFNMIKNCVYSIPCSCGKTYKGETGRTLKVRLEEHRKAIVRREIEKSGMADHIWKEKENHLPL